MKRLITLCLLSAVASATTPTPTAQEKPVRAAPVPRTSPEVIKPTADDYQELRRRLLAPLEEDYKCNRPAAEAPISLYPLNDKIWLAQMPCWSSSYNGADLFALLDEKRQLKERVPIDDGYDYSNEDGRGVIEGGGRAGGLGCGSETKYVWDGQQFRAEATQAFCPDADGEYKEVKGESHG